MILNNHLDTISEIVSNLTAFVLKEHDAPMSADSHLAQAIFTGYCYLLNKKSWTRSHQLGDKFITLSRNALRMTSSPKINLALVNLLM